MGITISGENNNDRILASDGVIDQLSGFNVVGVMTATSFTGDLTGDVTGNLTGNVTGNINNTTLLLQTGGTERVRIDSSGRVLIGTTTLGHESADDLTIASSGSTGISIRANPSNASNIHFGDGTGADQYRGIVQYHHADNSMRLFTNAVEKLRITSDGKVGINNNNPLSGVHISDGTPYGSPQNSNRKGTLTISAGSNSSADIQLLSANYNHIFFGDAADPNTGMIWYEHTGSRTDSLNFATAGQERIHITSAGNVEVKASGADQNRSIKIEGTNGSSELQGVVLESDGENAKFHIKTNAGGGTPTNKLTIETISGSVGIGTDAPQDALTLYDNDNNVGLYFQSPNTGNGGGDGFRIGRNDTHAFLWNYETQDIAFATNGSQHMVLRSTGQLGIGTVTSIPADAKKLTVICDGVGVGIHIGNKENLYPAGSTGYSDIRFSFYDYLTGGYQNGGEAIIRARSRNAYTNSRTTDLMFMTASDDGDPSSGDATEKLRLNTIGQLSLRGTTTGFSGTGDLDALQLYYETDSGQASIGPYSSGGSTHLSFYTNSGGNAATEKMVLGSSEGTMAVKTTSYPETTEFLTLFKAGVANGNRFKNRYIKIRNNYTGSLHGGVPIVWEANADGSNNKAYGAVVTEGNGDIRFLNAAATSEKAIGTDLLNTISEKLRITSDGKVGIKNSNPLYRLDIGDGANDPPSGYQFRINAAGDYIFALAKQGNASFSIRNNSTSVVHLNTQNSKRLALGVSSGSNSGSIEEHVNINSSGSLIVGSSSYGAAGSFSVGATGTFRQVLASGTSQDTLIGAISGVSNGFQITTDSNNAVSYKFHNGSTNTNIIKTNGYFGTGTSNPVSQFVVSKQGGEGVEFVPGNRTDENDIYHYDRGSNVYCSYRTYATKHEFWRAGSAQAVEVTPAGNLKVYQGARIRLATSNDSDDSWVNIQSDNHYNVIFGLNLHLNYSGNSGTHQVKQRNTHGTIGSAGMFIGGNGSNNNSNISFFRNGQGSGANTVFSQDSWKFQIASSIRQNYNLMYLQRGYFKNDTNNSNANNFPLAAGSGIGGYAWGYQEAFSTSNGIWTHPYPDLVIGYHTGLRFGGNTSYGGCRFFQDHPSGNQTLLFSIGNGNSNVHVVNSLSKGGGSFRIAHPHPSKKYTHDLVHSFIEGPQMDLIYRGKVDLVDGTATVNIDTKSNMTDGTFVLLNRDVQCFTSNETGWTAVKGSVSGNILTITAQDNTCTDTISWMVVGERQDDKIKSLDMTDDDGNLIVEPLTIEETHM